MSTLVDQLRKRLEFDENAEHEYLKPAFAGTHPEELVNGALQYSRHLAPLHELLLRVVEAADELIDGIDDPELSDALAALSAVVGKGEG